MEDSHIAHTDLDNGVSLFGVFDGHGGEFLFAYTLIHRLLAIRQAAVNEQQYYNQLYPPCRPGSSSMGQR